MFPLVRWWIGPTGLLLALRLILCSGSLLPPLVAAEAVRKSFALPAAAAEVTLEAFSDQTDVQIVYPIEDVRGVTTNALQGEFAIRDALERLVAGTALEVERDGNTGALVVRRKRPAPDQAGSVETVPNPPQPLPMKNRPVLSIIASWLGLALNPASSAQAVDTASASGAIEGRVQNVASGRYLPNARVSVLNTDIMVFTDETGRYRIARVPIGSQTIEVSYTGLDAEKIPVVVVAGQSVTQEVGLTNAELFGAKDATVRLNPFVVVSAKETDMATIAINEQRIAPNIKNVVSTDSHGDVLSGNIGEFLKYLPGVDTGGNSYEPGEILIRGFPANYTGVTTDGAPLANPGSANGASDRTFSLATISINNVSRVEVTKMPTPATPADSLAGSVNMISKSAFESSRMQVKYNVSLTSSAGTFSLSREPRSNETEVYYVKPSGNVDLTLPLSKDFGVTFTALHHVISSPLNRANRTLNATAANTGASFERPYMAQIQSSEVNQFRTRDSFGLKADWRVTRNSVVSAGLQYTYYVQDAMNSSFQALTGTIGTPSVAGGMPLTFGPDFTHGATGRGNLGQLSPANILYNNLGAGTVNYRFNDGVWKIDGLITASEGRSRTDNAADGFFRGLQTSTRVPVRVSFLDIDDIAPGRVEAFTNDNQRFDIYDINNYVINNNGTNVNKSRMLNGNRAGAVNINRQIQGLSFPLSFQGGWAGREQTQDRESVVENYTYRGVNGNLSVAPFANSIYVNVKQPMITGIERSPENGRWIPYASPTLAWRAFEKDPNLFFKTPAQLVAEERSKRTNSQYFRESVNAFYLQSELRLLKNRLTVLGGVRYEKTVGYGEGLRNDASAVFLRNADGSFARNAAGARIRNPAAGTAGSMEEINLTLTERGFTAKRSYDDYYPSVHFSYNFSENLIARAAYARTYGRPNYTEIIPNTLANEADLGLEPNPSAVLGTLTVKNTGLLPWTAENYEMSLEYYSDSGGLLSASVFHKQIGNFFGTFAKVATASDLELLGLDQDYLGWQVNTTINAGDAEVSGVELSLNHSLRPLGKWGQHFRGFANFTQIEVSGPKEADFRGFLPRTVNWGLTYSRSPFVVTAKWNYRSDVQQEPFPGLGPDAYTYFKGDIRMDVSLSYQITKRTALFFNARNVTGVIDTLERRGSQTPEYAKSYMNSSYGGAVLYAGIKGSY